MSRIQLTIGLLALVATSGVIAREGGIADLSAFTQEETGSTAVLAALKSYVVDKVVSMKNKVTSETTLYIENRAHKIKYFRIDSDVHFYVFDNQDGKGDLTHRVYLRLPDLDNLYFVPKKCELIKNLNDEPPALKKCASAKLVADDISKMVADSSISGGKSYEESQKSAQDIVQCIKKHVDVQDIGIQCLEEGIQMSPAWYQEQLNEQASRLRSIGKKVRVEGSRLVIEK